MGKGGGEEGGKGGQPTSYTPSLVACTLCVCVCARVCVCVLTAVLPTENYISISTGGDVSVHDLVDVLCYILHCL